MSSTRLHIATRVPSAFFEKNIYFFPLAYRMVAHCDRRLSTISDLNLDPRRGCTRRSASLIAVHTILRGCTWRPAPLPCFSLQILPITLIDITPIALVAYEVIIWQMPRKHRAGKARRVRAQINLAIKREYERRYRETLTGPRIIKDIPLDPPLPREIIDAIKQRPVPAPLGVLACLRDINATNFIMNLNGQHPIIYTEGSNVPERSKTEVPPQGTTKDTTPLVPTKIVEVIVID